MRISWRRRVPARASALLGEHRRPLSPILAASVHDCHLFALRHSCSPDSLFSASISLLFTTIMPVSREPTDRDPLSAALRPPIDETEEEKAHRLADEEAAKRVSLAIDEAIRLEDKQRKKRKIVRLLLLGQSESGRFNIRSYFKCPYSIMIPGKSTTLRRESSFSAAMRMLVSRGGVRHDLVISEFSYPEIVTEALLSIL